MQINAKWHKQHPIPKNPSEETRVAWHLEHRKNCACRKMPEKIEKEISKKLQTIPGVGVSLAGDLMDLGFGSVKGLAGQDPEQMYIQLCRLKNAKLDRCVLYTFRCAVYYASTPDPEPEKLKWWNWKDTTE